MKQNLPPAKATSYFLILLLALSGFTCTTPPRQVSSYPNSKQYSSSADSNWKINLNTASARELKKLPGVGEVIAQRIVNHRQQHGPFRRAEHLMMVQGISERKFRELQPLIIVE